MTEQTAPEHAPAPPDEGKYVYYFGDGHAEGNAKMKNVLGGKGAGLAEMTNIGVPVPPGFTISTGVCTYFYEHGKTYPPELKQNVAENLARVEESVGRKFGDRDKPLLVSVRSGARASMPGMMDTILNLGLNDETVQGLAKSSGDERFALDSYRRFIQMYSDVVLEIDREHFEHELFALRDRVGVKTDAEIPADGLRELVATYKKIVRDKLGKDFPQDVDEQLWGAIGAVFNSWNNQRAITYRKLNGIPDDWGTAVNVQSMVFGNMGDDCATGVAFTRNPSNGEKRFFGEYLPNAQGEDVVAGIRTPLPISKAQAVGEEKSLEETFPDVYAQLVDVYQKLESHYRDMQDIEFTIQSRKLYLLQTRTGKRTGFAAVKIACDMVDEGLIEAREAVERVEANQIIQLLAPVFDAKEKAKVLSGGRLLGRGLPAGPGAATGRIAFNAEHAVSMAKSDPVILVRIETSPEDIAGMHSAAGILTTRGGLTSHAAVVARGMGRPCVVGAGSLKVDYGKGELRSEGHEPLEEGDWVSIDGTTGEILGGKLATRPSEVVQVLLENSMKPEESETYRNFDRLLGWADEIRTLGIRTNADTPADARVARLFGAKGIGLCRTEHMFFAEERILRVREMILARDEKGRRRALGELLPFQQADFEGIFRELAGMPVTVRLLDPPLHEFLPQTESQISSVAREMNWGFVELRNKVNQLHETNPMLGHRGCRLGITFPEIYEMQVRAIFQAACAVKRDGVDVHPEVMIPLVGTVKELQLTADMTRRVAEEVMKGAGVRVDFLVGTMIEIPRAALIADKLAATAQFFSFGTNDLTQMTFGYSRDDAGTFLPDYVDKKILPKDPFESIDQEGVGQLVRLGAEHGRSANAKLKVGVCGEHGGDPDSIRFFRAVGLDYVSCSPYRVPVARLAAAQAELEQKAYEG
ncbi:MAG: pyruvate, phosphate dikinase [Acidobacteria bacterium]|nr:pyruvate, phosphate dikinase [Acidobacteriota bacterium]MBV9477209.1 pyruvate, phosphate dikinase [Acidobacteriota bacterium]